MTTTVKATYVDGVFKPTKPLTLAVGESLKDVAMRNLSKGDIAAFKYFYGSPSGCPIGVPFDSFKDLPRFKSCVCYDGELPETKADHSCPAVTEIGAGPIKT